jgi:hypothetical protein
LLVTGCAKDLTEDFVELKNRACACAEKKDAACGKGVLADLGKLLEGARKATANEEKAAAATKELGTCLMASGVSAGEIAALINEIAAKDAPTSAPAEPSE